jgi:hypothetical protein
MPVATIELFARSVGFLATFAMKITT